MLGPNTTEILDVALRSVLVASVATVAVLPFAVLTGYYLARHRGRWRNTIDVIVMLPMVMPPVAIGLVLLWLLSPRPSRALSLVTAYSLPGRPPRSPPPSWPCLDLPRC